MNGTWRAPEPVAAPALETLPGDGPVSSKEAWRETPEEREYEARFMGTLNRVMDAGRIVGGGLEDADTVIDEETPPVEVKGSKGSRWSIPAVEETKTCKCGATGLVSELFGYRHVPGPRNTIKQIPQGPCKKCRADAARAAMRKASEKRKAAKLRKAGAKGRAKTGAEA
jgi:hypothetical protein